MHNELTFCGCERLAAKMSVHVQSGMKEAQWCSGWHRHLTARRFWVLTRRPGGDFLREVPMSAGQQPTKGETLIDKGWVD